MAEPQTFRLHTIISEGYDEEDLYKEAVETKSLIICVFRISCQLSPPIPPPPNQYPNPGLKASSYELGIEG